MELVPNQRILNFSLFYISILKLIGHEKPQSHQIPQLPSFFSSWIMLFNLFMTLWLHLRKRFFPSKKYKIKPTSLCSVTVCLDLPLSLHGILSKYEWMNKFTHSPQNRLTSSWIISFPRMRAHDESIVLKCPNVQVECVFERQKV